MNPRAANGDRTFRYFPAEELVLTEDVPGARFFAIALEQARLTYFELDPGARFPEHHHAGEQLTLVLSGRLLFVIGGLEIVVGRGEAIAIPGGVRHAVRSLDAVVAVDAWSPPFDRIDAQRRPAP